LLSVPSFQSTDNLLSAIATLQQWARVTNFTQPNRPNVQPQQQKANEANLKQPRTFSKASSNAFCDDRPGSASLRVPTRETASKDW
jgi:hypothetical protein